MNWSSNRRTSSAFGLSGTCAPGLSNASRTARVPGSPVRNFCKVRSLMAEPSGSTCKVRAVDRPASVAPKA